QGLLFAGARDPAADLADFPLAADYDFSGYVFEKATIDELPFNWKAFLEHPTWKRLFADPQYAETVSKITSRFLVPTGYSQI
ncbi:MAG: NIPSNAP family protein, partial [Gemmatimonadaceae bacterium]|nr:NIPSNAP family protein [Gemmatimonadaceae bacterium]